MTLWISRGGRGRPLHLALGGISVSLFLGAITTYVLLLSGPQTPSLLFWLSGGFQGRSWPQLLYMTPWVAVAVVGAFACQRVIGMLALSEHASIGMGLNMNLWKPILLVLAVMPVAGVAPVAGPVAFVGLVSPAYCSTAQAAEHPMVNCLDNRHWCFDDCNCRCDRPQHCPAARTSGGNYHRIAGWPILCLSRPNAKLFAERRSLT